MMIVEILMKIILVGLLFKYRDIGDHIRKKVSMCGLTYYLHGRKNQNNFLTAILP